MSASLAVPPAMQPRSPARFKAAATGQSTTTTQKSSRTRQRSDNGGEKHSATGTTARMVSEASLEDDIRRMTENFEDEVRLHRADLERSIERARQQIIQRLDAITPALVDSLAGMTVKQFVEVYGCDLFAAHRAIKLGTLAEANDEINRTIKKRKRIATATGTDSANNTAATDEDALHAGSPMKSRKNMRIAPPTPKTGTAASSSAFPRSASRPGLLTSNSAVSRAPQQHGSAPTQITRGIGSSSRFAGGASARASTSSNAGNFIYKARPSLTVPTNFAGPRLPQTPKSFGAGSTGSLGTARTAGKSTARRLPRKHESIQAYSMNGSPLGMFDLAVEQAAASANSQSSDPAQPPTSAHPSSQSGTEDDWEILSNKATASVAASIPSTSAMPSLSRQVSNTPLAKTSPSKLGRKPSHSAFKDKILAGASKAFGGGSHMQNRFASPAKQHPAPGQVAGPASAGSSSYSLARPPTREEFTFQTTPALPSIPSQSNVLEQWEAMKADLAKMCPDPEQRKMFEQRYLEIMRG